MERRRQDRQVGRKGDKGPRYSGCNAYLRRGPYSFGTDALPYPPDIYSKRAFYSQALYGGAT